MSVKSREKEDGAFKFYEQESSRRVTIHKAWPIITHDPRPTHPRQLVNLLFFPSTWKCAYDQDKHIQKPRFTN